MARLIGAPPGYVGYEEGGQLTEAVRRRPYSVVLLDEIEKAHQDAFHVLLQIMEDGRLTDGHGRTVDFRNVILMMTSNLGSTYVLEASDQRQAEMKALEALRTTFRPEFLNRVDAVVVFRPLDSRRIREIVDIQVRRFAPLLAQRELTLELTEAAKDFLAETGFDPAFGARPLRRAIQEHVLEPLSEKIIGGEIQPGAHVVVDRDGDRLSLRGVPRPSPRSAEEAAGTGAGVVSS